MITLEEYNKKYGENPYRLSDSVPGYYRYFKENAKVGDGATVCYYSDRDAYTIVKRTKETLTLQRDKAVLSDEFHPVFVPGGFAGTVINQHEQRYTYEPDPDGSTVTAHWSEKKVGYYWHGIRVIPGRHEFYDYNF